ncbi:MAG: phosphoribulokinase [Clostridia bacterium]|nr:phosphoribulokinase [Clostridia bacterium]
MKRILDAIAQIRNQKNKVVVAIEGGSAAGKSTLAARLYKALGGNLYHMDDFFLPPSMRTAKRLGTPGGNIDYERFYNEVVHGMISGKPFSYGVFSCKEARITHSVSCLPSSVHIVEGVYSMHPHFGDYTDLRIFLEISPSLQKQRIEKRNPHNKEDFFTRWIPMENAYFSSFAIKSNADMIISNSEEDVK